MASLTLNVDEGLLRRARIRALQQGTSVNQLVRQWLEHYLDEDADRQIGESLVETFNQAAANSGPAPWRWSREELYEERLGEHGR
ncbi:hypothetical protein JQS43_07365 [Natronosporangium hydrolyticum]|uniref:Uncharacterized protein n=1 Tax=Natronosporangium hydrolyticum TaxID=2811111 RepID=A0A895YE56_9ACTN|nr:hypothetical protein [Natronosporangium hydrolyticum]QSB16114.1 hypothetical protein JQS43_07365 [Natronosporangium hydrolyticum]